MDSDLTEKREVSQNVRRKEKAKSEEIKCEWKEMNGLIDDLREQPAVLVQQKGKKKENCKNFGGGIFIMWGERRKTGRSFEIVILAAAARFLFRSPAR